MGSRKWPTLKVIYTASALRELDEIWDWNRGHYSEEHAEQYVKFLEDHIESLSTDRSRERQVISRPNVNYILMQRKSKRHGHVAVYRIFGGQIEILHVFHSAQDWQAKIANDLD